MIFNPASVAYITWIIEFVTARTGASAAYWAHDIPLDWYGIRILEKPKTENQQALASSATWARNSCGSTIAVRG